MCIAVYKPAGVKMPSKKTLSNCFNANSDGAGFMFSYENKVHIKKGYMSFNAFYKALNSELKRYSKNGGKDLPMVLHFRITSQGGVKPSLTHPYPLTDSYADMMRLDTVSDIGIAHNGIITLTSSYSVKDHNDTMEFIKEIVYPLIHKKIKTWYLDKGVKNVFQYILGNNRVVLLHGDGHAELFGSWETENGVFYSNGSYRERKYTQTSFMGDYWKNHGYHSYNSDNTYGVSGFKSTKELSNGIHIVDVNELDKENDDDELPDLSDGQKCDLDRFGTCYCDNCGEELEMDWFSGDPYAYCPVCGDCFNVTRNQYYKWLQDNYVCYKESDAKLNEKDK